MKAVSFDFWGTLMVSNPDFKKAQANLAKEFFNIDEQEFHNSKNNIKKQVDYLVESAGLQLERVILYRKLIPNLNIKDCENFIRYSDELFLKHPPILREPETDIISILKEKGYRVYISSNTVFIYGKTLSKVIFDNFGIIHKNCKFSDETQGLVSKPSREMFDFEIKPDWHIGDNLITDGASEEFGIKHYHINNKQNFKTFLENENI